MGSVCIVLWPGFQPLPIKWLLLGDAWSMSPVAGQATNSGSKEEEEEGAGRSAQSC